jgi:3-oxoacyl-(acyl-carrier-protein) synthase
MVNFMLPVDDIFVEAVAKAIAKNRMERDSADMVYNMIGKRIDKLPKFEESLDRMFEKLWNGTDEDDLFQKEQYREDARAAIRTINLRLLTQM